MQISKSYLVMHAPIEPGERTVDKIKAIDAFALTGSVREARRVVRLNIDRGDYKAHGNGTIFVVERQPRYDDIETRHR